MGGKGRGIRHSLARSSSTPRYKFFYGESSYIRTVPNKYDGEEDEDERTEIIYSVSEVGVMVDFLKNNPFVSVEDYMWKMNPCLIKLMAIDNTRVHYLSDKEKKNRNTKYMDGTNLSSDLGVPIFGEKK